MFGRRGETRVPFPHGPAPWPLQSRDQRALAVEERRSAPTIADQAGESSPPTTTDTIGYLGRMHGSGQLRQQPPARQQQGEQRVLAGGVPSHHSPSRTTLRATAVSRCCRCVLANPRYRVRRRPLRRMACVCVPSIPARRAYWVANSAVSCRCREAWMASWKTCGRTVSWWGASLAWVHAWRTGQPRQVAAWKRMRTTGSPEISRPGVHLTLVCPWGQRACLASQSMTKALKSYPRPARRWWRYDPQGGPTTSI